MQNGNDSGTHSIGDGCTVEIVLVEARDLVAADWGGTSDPYVSVRYGQTKKRTKVSVNVYFVPRYMVLDLLLYLASLSSVSSIRMYDLRNAHCPCRLSTKR